jgi:hypothetical protein
MIITVIVAMAVTAAVSAPMLPKSKVEDLPKPEQVEMAPRPKAGLIISSLAHTHAPLEVEVIPPPEQQEQAVVI